MTLLSPAVSATSSAMCLTRTFCQHLTCCLHVSLVLEANFGTLDAANCSFATVYACYHLFTLTLLQLRG